MTEHARVFTEARSRWRIDTFDPDGPPARAALAQITASRPAAERRRRALWPRRLAGALAAAAIASVAAFAIPGAAPDVVAQAASALEGEPGQVIVYGADLRFGTGADRSGGATVHLEGNATSTVGTIVTRGEDWRDPTAELGTPSARASLGNRIPIANVTLVELRELLEAARDGRDDSVEYIGETSVDGRAAFELRMMLDAGASRTLFVDRESYLPVRFEQTGPGSEWAVLDFTDVEWVSEDDLEEEWNARQEAIAPPNAVRPEDRVPPDPTGSSER
jgi:hypothetical protein